MTKKKKIDYEPTVRDCKPGKEEQKKKLIEMMHEDEKNGIYMTKSERLREYAKLIDDGVALRIQEIEISEFLLSLADTLDFLELSDEQIELESYHVGNEGNANYWWQQGAKWYREQMRNKLK